MVAVIDLSSGFLPAASLCNHAFCDRELVEFALKVFEVVTGLPPVGDGQVPPALVGVVVLLDIERAVEVDVAASRLVELPAVDVALEVVGVCASGLELFEGRCVVPPLRTD